MYTITLYNDSAPGQNTVTVSSLEDIERVVNIQNGYYYFNTPGCEPFDLFDCMMVERDGEIIPFVL